MLFRELALSLLIGSALVPNASAQGFGGVSLAVGVGSVEDHCSDCTGARLGTLSGTSLGAEAHVRVTTHVQVGMALLRNRAEDPGRNRQQIFVGAFAGIAPSFLRHALVYAGPGYQWYQDEYLSLSAQTRASGPAFLAGLSYRIPIAGTVAVLPFLETVVGTSTRSNLNGLPSITIAPRLLHAGLRLGLSR